MEYNVDTLLIINIWTSSLQNLHVSLKKEEEVKGEQWMEEKQGNLEK